MKRIFLLMCATAVVLSGCNATSVGIIGGADGPTRMIVSDNDDSAEFESDNVRMLRIDGALYYETGEESEVDARCGNMDGTFKKSVPSNMVPQNDNESNFDDSSEYQIGSSKDTVEILIDDDWEIFAKIDTEADVLKYKYCCELEGRLPNAAADSKYLVLANDETVTFDDAAYKFFGSDLRKMKDIYCLPLVD